MNVQNYGYYSYKLVRKSVRKRYRPSLKVLTEEPRPSGNRHSSRKIYAHKEPHPLQIAGQNKIVAWACGHCGAVHSEKYRAIFNRGAEESARECCRRPTGCRGCGTDVEQHQSKCDECCRKDSYIRERNMARKAQVVADDGGPVYSEWGGGSWGDGYSHDLDSHIEYWRDEAPEEIGEDDVVGPPFVFLCHGYTPHITLDRIEEQLADELPEDFEFSDLSGYEALTKAIDEFNKVQKECSYTPDYKRIVVIDEARFREYIETDINGLPDVRYRRRTKDVIAPKLEESAA